MDIELILLAVIAIFVAAAFVFAFMRLWFVTHYDANLGNKVKGLSLSFDKLRKEVRALPEQFSNDIERVGNKEMAADLAGFDLSNPTLDMWSMTLEEAAESIGIDPESLNNPLIRPMAEKIFQGIKDKVKGGEDAGGTGIKDGY